MCRKWLGAWILGITCCAVGNGSLRQKRLSGDERKELKRLRKEVRLLRMEKEILKKASQYFAKEMK